MSSMKTGERESSLCDSKEGRELDRTLPGHGNAPVKDQFSPPQRPLPARRADAANEVVPQGQPKPLKA